MRNLLTQLTGLFILAVSTSTFAADIADTSNDKYEYTSTPVAVQNDDLQDDDQDGVINARDLCPDTPSDATIDNDGCGAYASTPEEKSLHILFANNSSMVRPIFQTQITELSDFLKQFPETSVEVRGYASKIGTTEYNLALSKKRAEEVKSILLKHGISEERIEVIAYGDTHLEIEGHDAISHAKNRRVVAAVFGYKGELSKRWTIFTTLPRVTEY